jgi:hypothetical protein
VRVGSVDNGFGEGREIWWTGCPPHWRPLLPCKDEVGLLQPISSLSSFINPKNESYSNVVVGMAVFKITFDVVNAITRIQIGIPSP